MTSHDDVVRVASASREIAAPARTIFELIADPTQQPRWDGSQRSRGASDADFLRAHLAA